jgi:hypothetical protein
MSDDPRIAYLDARGAYEEAYTAARAHITFVRSVGQAMDSSPGGFIETTIEGKKSTIHSAYDMSRWPTAKMLQEALVAMKVAFTVCHERWSAVPHDRQSGCVKPPAKIGAP